MRVRAISSRSALATLIVLHAVAAAPAPQERTDASLQVPTAAALERNEIAIGALAPRGRQLAPCIPSSSTAFEMTRTSPGMWAGTFVVTDLGQGAWHLLVESIDEARSAKFPVSTAALPQRIATNLIASKKVRIALVGPGDAAARCPTVLLEKELEPFGGAQPRGVFDRDERWTDGQSDLLLQPDSQKIRGWAPSVVHVQVLGSRGELLPCTAFAIAPHIIMTASHCVLTQDELNTGLLFLSNREVAGSDLRLFMVQGDLDFSLIWVEGPPIPEVLTVGGDAAGPLVVWQHPVDLGKVVSVKGCRADTAAGMQLSHRCDTSVGSSGSPIQSRESGAVVALHTDGCTVFSGTASCENFGTRLSEIRARISALEKPLRAAHPAAANELLTAIGK